MDTTKTNAPTLGFATPENWMVVRHPDFELVDEVKVRTQERWKESELSGSEWRFSYIADFLHKGHVLKTSGLGGRMEWAMLGLGGAYLSVSDNGVPNSVFDLEKTVCAQPGCRNPASVFYRVKKFYNNNGDSKEFVPYTLGGADAIPVIRFCQKHRHRGDCGLQDADANYEELPHPALSALAPKE